MKFSKILLFPALALMLSGCAGYRVGSTLDPSIRTVSLSIINETDEPSIEVAVMKALRAELQLDGRLEVRSQDEADAMLTVRLSGFDLQALAYNRRQGTRAEEYRMTLSGSVVLSNAETDEVIFENPKVQGEGDFPYAADLTTTKRGVLPEAAQDLARKVVSTVVTAW
jgi:outer membrane lipopolysaccharide assembly protein LptE/RlpB